MKKIITLACIAALLFTACQKDLQQPAGDEAASLETVQVEKTETSATTIGGKQVFEKLLFIKNTSQVAARSSSPRSSHKSSVVIWLDANGGKLPEGNIFSGDKQLAYPASGLTKNQLNQILKLVEDDFSPWKVTVTFHKADYLKAPADRRVWCVISTGLEEFFGASAGLAAYDTYGVSLGKSNPNCFVMANNAFGLSGIVNGVAGNVSHEIGHVFGLDHRSKTVVEPDGSSVFYARDPGIGEGERSWCPIMGATTERNVSTWGTDDFQAISNRVQLKPDEVYGQGVISNEVMVGVLGPNDKDKYTWIWGKTPSWVRVMSNGNVDLSIIVLGEKYKELARFSDPNSLHINWKIPHSLKGKVRYVIIHAEEDENSTYVPTEENVGSFTFVFRS